MYILPGALAPLAGYRQFILVELSQAVDKLGAPVPGKTVKHPIDHTDLNNPHTQGKHDAHKPSIWMSWQEAAALADSLPVRAHAVGWCIGFVITAADPFGCLDLDECTAPMGGGWIPEVATMTAAVPGAIELSLSGRGLHSWFTYQGVAPIHGKKSDKLRGHKWMELYTEARFMALGSTANGVMNDLTAYLPDIIDKYFPPLLVDTSEGGIWNEGPCEGYTALTDDELMTKAMSSARPLSAADAFGGAKMRASFAELWNCDMNVMPLAFPPEGAGKEFGASDADFALAKELSYWTGRDHARIERLMMQSGLVRDKWQTMRRNWTYLQQTILNGVAACTAVYTRALRPMTPVTGVKLAPVAINDERFMGRDEMAALFAGCVYIQDLNCILLPNGDIVDQSRFKARFAGYTFLMGVECKPSKDAWDAFINNQCVAFPRVEGTSFDPSAEFQDVTERGGRQWVNVYKKPHVDRRPGDVKPFMEFLYKLLPNGDDAVILLSYMAALVQNPGVKFRWAPFIQGVEGNGKSTITRCLKHAIGNKYIFTVKPGMIENGFNGWLENNVLYVADDIYSSRDRADMMEALKSLITETDQSITLKGVDAIEKTIIGNFLFTDNHKDAMTKRDATRRICTLYCAQQSPYDRTRDGLTKRFFANEFIPWLKDGGYAYVAEMLHTMAIDPRYDPAGECQEAPETSVTREAIIDGRTGVEHEVAEWVELLEPGFCGDFVSAEMLKRKLKSEPQFAKSSSPLKIMEMLGRLGYEKHRGLRDGRTEVDVQPDDKRVILYVKRDSTMAELKDAAVIAALYTDSQEIALTAVRAKMMQVMNGGVK